MRQIVVAIFLLAVPVMGFTGQPKLSLIQNGSVKKEVFELISALGYNGPNKPGDLDTYCQKSFLRPAGVERWDVLDDELITQHRNLITGTLDKLGFFQKVMPQVNQTYENVLILGASIGRMRSRVGYFKTLTEQGLRFKRLYFLTGARPLDPKIENHEALYQPSEEVVFRPGWKKGSKDPKNENEAARLVWDQLIVPETRQPIYIDVPMQEGVRPSTIDLIQSWLTHHPSKGRTLVISNNPYIPYQHAVVVRALLESNFIGSNESHFIETVGAGAQIKAQRLRVMLDNISRILSNEKKVWDLHSSKKSS